jgi:hypothetical protein
MPRAIGTAGQSKTKELASAEGAASEVAKLIREKTGKGYVLAEGGADAGAGAQPATAATRNAEAAGAPGAEPEGTPAKRAAKKAPAKKSKAADPSAPAVPPCGALDEKGLRKLGLKLRRTCRSTDTRRPRSWATRTAGSGWMRSRCSGIWSRTGCYQPRACPASWSRSTRIPGARLRR